MNSQQNRIPQQNNNFCFHKQYRFTGWLDLNLLNFYLLFFLRSINNRSSWNQESNG